MVKYFKGISREENFFHKCRFSIHFKKSIFYSLYFLPHTWSFNLIHINSTNPYTIPLLSREFHSIPITSPHVVPSKLWTKVK